MILRHPRATRTATRFPCTPLCLSAGEGPERAALEARAAELGVAAEFTGYVERPEEALATFDVFALSSDTEQMPLSVVSSAEHTSELQSLMRISYAVFCLKKKTSK